MMFHESCISNDNGALKPPSKSKPFKVLVLRCLTIGALIALGCLLLIAITVPGYLRARDSSRYTAAKDTLASLQVAVEMVAAENPGTATGTGRYTNAKWGMNNICKKYFATDACTDTVAGNRALQPLIEKTVSNFSMVVTAKDGKPDATYIIKGQANDKPQCKICITPNGIFPESYDPTVCATDICPDDNTPQRKPDFVSDHERFLHAKEVLSEVKAAVEKIAAHNPGTVNGTGPYTNVTWGKNNLCKIILETKDCTDFGVGDNTLLEKELIRHVTGFSLSIAPENGKPDSTYIIRGRALDKYNCRICVTPRGVFPEKYNRTDCTADRCL